MNQQTIQGKVLTKLLTTKRPHGSETNKRITLWLRDQLPFELKATAFLDGAGNLHVDNRSVSTHRTLFVAHVDTVHSKEGKNKIAKSQTHWRAKGDVLGADDGAGVALLFHMIHNNVAGYYVFTQGEERGGIGARFLAEKMQDLLGEFDRAVAFDRRGIDSVITHQGWGRCCSDAFGDALCDALMAGSDQLMMLNDDTGVYTDTAEFTDIIPECTNISVGYNNEHTQTESLDLAYYQHLSSAVLHVDWDALPVSRDPRVADDLYAYGAWGKTYSTYTKPAKGSKKKKKSKYQPVTTVPAYDYASLYSANDFDDFYAYADMRRADVIDAVVDAQYGFTEPLSQMIAASVYPEDPALVMKHLSFKQLDPRALDEAYTALEMGDDMDGVLLSLFDELHTA
jgi:hypothetical protein